MRLGAIARSRAAQTPDQIGYRFLDHHLNETRLLTYSELDQRARLLGGTLVAWTRCNARVVIALDSGAEFVLGIFACLYAGRVGVPAAPPRRIGDAWQRLLAIVHDAGPELVIVESTAIAERLALEPAARGCRIVTFAEFSANPASDVELATEPSELALLQYTSGSTGDPKGVMLTEAALHANLEAMRVSLGHSHDSHGVNWLPMHHDMGLVGCVLEPLFVGFPSTLLPPLSFVQRPARWLQAISRYRGTVGGGPPFAFRACLDRIRADQLTDVDLSSWQVAFVGAERVPDDLLRCFHERFALHGLARGTLRVCYGLAEATLMVACTPQRATEPAPSIATAEADRDAPAPASCGACVVGHELICVDAQGRKCAEGECGEIWVLGPSVAAGYYGRARESERVFSAYCEGRGPYLRTGDLGVLHAGELFVVGRIKDIVIVRGRKFAPEDIEATAALSHPAVSGTLGAAFSLARGEGEVLVLVQEVTRHAARGAEHDEICAAIRERVVNAHGVSPAAIVLVAPGGVPRTTSGKVQRSRCRALFVSDKLASLGTARTRTAGARVAAISTGTSGEA
jgi:acyl-CoA synthetase (AMP-forming)/AMP-acid ligase II